MANPTPAPEALEALDAFLVTLNQESAKVILPLFRADHGLEDKSGGKAGAFDPVTKADRGAEQTIRTLIAERFPGHGVIGEEYGDDRPDAEFVWVVDPVDGTRAFIAGLPVWTTLIGLRFQGAPVLGSIGQPWTGELFIGHAGGARLISGAGSRPLTTRKGTPLARALMATTDPEGCFDDLELAAWRRVRAAARLARTGCDAYAYAMVAAGALDLVLESGLKCWDIEAAIPLLAGAGGQVSDWRGRGLGGRGGQMAIVGDARLLDEVLPLLAEAAA